MIKFDAFTNLKKIVKKRNGQCLSKKYYNAKTKFIFKCAQNHKWKATPNNIQQGKWCPICGHIKSNLSRMLSIKEMQRIAKSRNGKCLSDVYINSKTKLEWQCSNGHTWLAIPSSVKRGTWCRCSY